MYKKKNKNKKWIIVSIVSVITNIAWYAFVGFWWGMGPFVKLHDWKMSTLPGNNKKYALDQVKPKKTSVLNGKKIIFLGSSITYGAASKSVSFADYIGKHNQATIVKEAVPGTTLVNNGWNSYIRRMKKLNESNVDLFVCQLSTNDASQKKALGTITDSKKLNSFDTKTVAGAIEYIIAYAEKTWNCPVVFYTNPRYDSDLYQEMVTLLKIQEKWNIGVINMWDDSEFNNISKEKHSLYMADHIHPTQAGYLEWWTPYMEEKLISIFEDKENN